jgi:hypothetical protein
MMITLCNSEVIEISRIVQFLCKSEAFEGVNQTLPGNEGARHASRVCVIVELRHEYAVRAPLMIRTDER